MENPYRSENPFAVVFGPLAWPRTYGRLLYLLLGLPLGVAYFTFYVTGLSLGIGLAILLVGFVILVAVLLASIPLGLLERFLTVHLLGEPLPPTGFAVPDSDDPWGWFKATLSNRVAWTAMVFMFLKFPLGLLTWIATIVALSVALGFTAAPILVAFGGDVHLGFWSPATATEALVLIPVGLAMIVLSAHLVNGMGWAWGKFARVMLGQGAMASPHTDGSPEPAPSPAGGFAPDAHPAM
ncbi:MAG TPA: sensor domain-containing protein [Gemmatimonadota bacterium]|nr:sensor domain-containing protein [Gemmatimonadota bacterium]